MELETPPPHGKIHLKFPFGLFDYLRNKKDEEICNLENIQMASLIFVVIKYRSKYMKCNRCKKYVQRRHLPLQNYQVATLNRHSHQ